MHGVCALMPGVPWPTRAAAGHVFAALGSAPPPRRHAQVLIFLRNLQPPTTSTEVYVLEYHDVISCATVNDVRLIAKPYPGIRGAIQIEMTPALKALQKTCVDSSAGRVAPACITHQPYTSQSTSPLIVLHFTYRARYHDRASAKKRTHRG